jgi:Ca2+-binding RTX toxin-like protein
MGFQAPISQTTQVNLGPMNDSAFIGQYVTVSVSTGDAIVGTGITNQQVIVFGTVISTTGFGINVGTAATAGAGDTVTIEAGGRVQVFGGSTAVRMTGLDNHIENDGVISAPGGTAILLWGIGAGTQSTIVNRGVIEGSDGIGHIAPFMAGSTEALSLVNSGIVHGTSQSFGGIFDTVTNDAVTNTGRMIGNVKLWSGDDSYSGAAGHLSGKLFGDAGNDVAIGGIDNDWFEGGTGNDRLTGNAGSDRLIGDAGNDRLFGGVGSDKLTGGANADAFVFNTALNAATNRDVVTDFSHVDDIFWLENAIFTKLGAGVHGLSPLFFRAGAAALDGNDYIVYNQATGLLSYDSNGNAAGGAIAFAVLTNHPALAANDFLVV